MASCSQYSAAFGYQVFITPVSACGVDLNSVNGGVGAGGFIDPTALAPATEKIVEGASAAEILLGDPGANIVYDNDTVTTETVFKLLGLTNAALETDTSSETVTTYDTESKGFDQNVATSKSWSLSLEGVSQFGDSAYKALRLLELNSVAGSLKCKIGRIGPSGTVESVYGYVTLTNFSESVEAGSIVSWSVTATGYGPISIDLDNSASV
ncbi:phage major tail 2 family protein [Synechococcus sp. SYN20]|uniref:phage tail tube protein n=1 Tax=Synechococcus sp. SYN20 TaxID=1050714 RepID=UPI001646D8E2|nr:phage tail tube protein [Synechococcus sp. SYN20]QNJ25981.1 phage major tail 2 family protein [Synechococcus sp. SYN20]